MKIFLILVLWQIALQSCSTITPNNSFPASTQSIDNEVCLVMAPSVTVRAAPTLAAALIGKAEFHSLWKVVGTELSEAGVHDVLNQHARFFDGPLFHWLKISLSNNQGHYGWILAKSCELNSQSRLIPEVFRNEAFKIKKLTPPKWLSDQSDLVIWYSALSISDQGADEVHLILSQGNKHWVLRDLVSAYDSDLGEVKIIDRGPKLPLIIQMSPFSAGESGTNTQSWYLLVLDGAGFRVGFSRSISGSSMYSFGSCSDLKVTDSKFFFLEDGMTEKAGNKFYRKEFDILWEQKSGFFVLSKERMKPVVATVTKELTLKSEPKEKSQSLGTIKPAEVVQLIRIQAESDETQTPRMEAPFWFQIKKTQQVGWVLADSSQLKVDILCNNIFNLVK